MYDTNEYDLIILDLNLPVTDGLDVYLMRHKDMVISAETLIEHIWNSDVDLF